MDENFQIVFLISAPSIEKYNEAILKIPNSEKMKNYVITEGEYVSEVSSVDPDKEFKLVIDSDDPYYEAFPVTEPKDLKLMKIDS